MNRMRALLFWALLLAIPFQGVAAASMLLCKLGGGSSVGAAIPENGSHLAHAEPGAQHFSAAGPANQQQHQHPAADHADADADAITGAADAAHHDASHKCTTCGVCAACHAVAMLAGAYLPLALSLPAALPSGPSAAVATTSLPVLKKPPRA